MVLDSSSESSSSSSSSSSSTSSSGSASASASADVEVNVGLPTAKAEVKVGGGASADASAQGGAKASSGAKFNAGASFGATTGLSFNGKANICVSVGKILSIVALALMFVAQFCFLIAVSGSCGVGQSLTFWLLVGWFCALLIMDLIGKPARILKWFPFVHYPIGVMALLLVLSLFAFRFCDPFPGGQNGGWAVSFSSFSGLFAWLVFIYLLIIALLLGFGVI